MSRFWSIFFFFFAVACFGVLSADLSGFFKTSKPPIARIIESRGSVRKMAEGDWVWEALREGSELSLGDSVSVGENSNSRLVLYAGGVLQLPSGASVVLGGSVDSVSLEFITGAGTLKLEKAAKSKVKIAQYQNPEVLQKKGGAEGVTPLVPRFSRVELQTVEKIDVRKLSTPEREKESIPAGKGLVSSLEVPQLAIEEVQLKNSANALTTHGKLVTARVDSSPDLFEKVEGLVKKVPTSPLRSPAQKIQVIQKAPAILAPKLAPQMLPIRTVD